MNRGWIWIGLCVALAACGDDDGMTADTSRDARTDTTVGDTEADVRSDVLVDTRVEDTGTVAPLTDDTVAYAGPGSRTRFNDVAQLSDGSLLIAGQARSLEWLPPSTALREIPITARSASAESVAFLLRVSARGEEILEAVHFPLGSVRDVFRIRTTEVPGEPTGAIYISGSRDTARAEDDGYYLARLDGNFVSSPVRGLEWSRDISAEPRRASGFTGTSAYKAIQPWDVGSDGRVIYGRGAEYDFDWAQLAALNADGSDAVVPRWPVHWLDSGDEFRGDAGDAPSAAVRSGVALKAGRAGSLRSTSAEDFAELRSDGNGRTDRPGRFPDDYFFSGPCLDSCPGGPGYTGYRTSDKPTQRLGGVAIDRRSGVMVFGTSTQSVLPGGNPDFEPAVIAMNPDGSLLWWNRLYEETDANSSPDQYVDAVAIDHARDRVVVLARAHGNNVVNLWRGDQIASRPDARGFQNQFTGTRGNIHISWLGAFALASGELDASTYVAELAEGLSGGVNAFDDDHPTLAGQPDPNSGWADLNTTRCRSRLHVDADGRPTIVCTGRRTITTANAYQQMEPVGGGAGTWNQFVRRYRADLSALDYSTLITGEWNRETGDGGGNTFLESALAVPGGIVAVGRHEADETDGAAAGTAIPVTASNPAWTRDAPEGVTAIVAFLATP